LLRRGNNPKKVKQVLDKIKTEGLLPTMQAVFNKLDEPLPLGYCNAGEVIAVGENVSEFKIGDRVASNGHHAEIVCIPKNLVARIPDEVSYEEAAFTVIGSIGLQGIRLANPTIGETVVVIGLGLIGLMTVQLLIANGCNVIGFDFDHNKVKLANDSGARAYIATTVDVVKTVESITNNVGCDAVIITASTKTNDVISQAAQMSRKRGRIVLVGVIGLDIQRADFFKKELSFQVSSSYGPGRYDEDYELKGIDYPIGFVRWTEKRNFETILNSLAKKQLNVQSLITERLPLKAYLQVYNNLGNGSIASILQYEGIKNLSNKIEVNNHKTAASGGVIGIVGAGNFTKMTVMPALKSAGATYKYISSAGGLTANSLAKKYGFQYSTTDYKEILKDQEVDLVLITTRHDKHAEMVIDALRAGKNVFVEKPLAITKKELEEIIDTYNNLAQPRLLTVGFNRRFSPHIVKVKQLIGSSAGNLNIIATMNAGFIPPDVWIQDMKVGGGRIIGEACHYIDLMVFLTGSKVAEVVMSALGENPSENTDNAIITLKFENGSQGVINYFSNGSKSYSKERIEVFSQGRNLVIDNFRITKGYGFNGFSSYKTSLDKGHVNQFKSLIERVKTGGESIIPFDEIINVTKTSFAAIQSLKEGNWIKV
jgi:predicted dehydrogenase/threonine dehydrogenase-like Zn-dependent dehydrogenase